MHIKPNAIFVALFTDLWKSVVVSFLWSWTQPSVRRIFFRSFFLFGFICGSCKYIIPLNRLNPDFIRFYIEIWINSATHKIHHLDLWIFGDTHKLQIKFKTHFQPNLNNMHRKMCMYRSFKWIPEIYLIKIENNHLWFSIYFTGAANIVDTDI